MKKPLMLRTICASLLTFFLYLNPTSGLAATVTFGVNNLATGILDLEFDNKLWNIGFSLLSVPGNESLFPTLGDPDAGRNLVIAINTELDAAGPSGILPNNVGAASDRYLVPGEITIGALTLVENSSQGLLSGGTWVLNSVGPFLATGAPVVATATFTGNLVPVPAAVWLFGTALIGFVGYSRRRKID